MHGAPLLPHQLQACAWLRSMWLQRQAAVLADDQGLGKTASAVAYIANLLQEFKSTAPVLIVAPLATLSFWEGGSTRHALLGVHCKPRRTICDGSFLRCSPEGTFCKQIADVLT